LTEREEAIVQRVKVLRDRGAALTFLNLELPDLNAADRVSLAHIIVHDERVHGLVLEPVVPIIGEEKGPGFRMRRGAHTMS